MVMEVLIVTGGRADWGLLQSPATLLHDDPRFILRIAATASHLDPAFGETVHEIETAGFTVDHRITVDQTGDSPAAVAQAMGRVIEGMGALLSSAPPDIILLLGDRWEILGVASAAAIALVPVAHIAGGDITEGAIDNAFRDAITNLSHLHFVTNALAGSRLRQMGLDPDLIHDVGSPGLDSLLSLAGPSPDALRSSLGLPSEGPLLLITFHPPTLNEGSAGDQFAALTAALDQLGPEVALLLTGSNTDPQGKTLTQAAQRYADMKPNAAFVTSLGHIRYASAMRAARAVVGNSSSGLYEAPSFGIPTVNIGDRQAGRLRAGSVIDVPPTTDEIASAIRQALAMNARGATNPYGDGQSGKRIVEVLARTTNPRSLLRKRFHYLG